MILNVGILRPGTSHRLQANVILAHKVLRNVVRSVKLQGSGCAQGIETVRRDNCQLVRTVVSTCLEMILINEDEEGAKAYVRATISDLLMNRLDLSLLVITKARTQSVQHMSLEDPCSPRSNLGGETLRAPRHHQGIHRSVVCSMSPALISCCQALETAVTYSPLLL